MHFGVVDHIRASALTTADRRPPSWNRITDSTHAPPVGNGIGEPHFVIILFDTHTLSKNMSESYKHVFICFIFNVIALKHTFILVLGETH